MRPGISAKLCGSGSENTLVPRQTERLWRAYPTLAAPDENPWLNPIEPKWVHGKRAVSEADRLLSADELTMRVYAYYGCEQEAHLVMPKKVA